MPQWTVPAEVLKVVDGDTFHLRLDLGWQITMKARCRIAGIDAPELDTEAGQAAKAYAQELLRPGDQVTFVSHSLDKYGRPLGSIILADQRNVGLLMISAGHAVVMI